MEFFNWSVLGTFAGAMFAVAILTQLTKEIPGIKNLPTQIWSYILAVVVLIGAEAFGGDLTFASGCLSFINAALVSLAANGGYEAVEKLRTGMATKPLE